MYCRDKARKGTRGSLDAKHVDVYTHAHAHVHGCCDRSVTTVAVQVRMLLSMRVRGWLCAGVAIAGAVASFNLYPTSSELNMLQKESKGKSGRSYFYKVTCVLTIPTISRGLGSTQ